MVQLPSRPAVRLALVGAAVTLILPVYGKILPPIWHLSFMAAALLLIALASCLDDRSRPRNGAVAVDATGPKIPLPPRRR
jgi:hypothetical protein